MSKQQLAFFRKLYLAWLIEQEPSNLPLLEAKTGMPRRTLQDSLKAMADIGIELAFVESPGERHNQGHYRIVSWGPINAAWVDSHAQRLQESLQR